MEINSILYILWDKLTQVTWQLLTDCELIRNMIRHELKVWIYSGENGFAISYEYESSRIVHDNYKNTYSICNLANLVNFWVG